MIEIKDKKLCSGCHACASICPKKCISMIADDEGFLYPVIDKKKCINCGLCKKICPVLSQKVSTKNKPIAYAAYNKDLTTRMKSSSGGVFSILARFVFEQKGVVVGAGFNDALEVEHTIAENAFELEKLQTSKYVQSRIGDMYTKTREFLNNGRYVLFTGTPCQIEGLYSFLNKDYPNLITQDIVCHGVPSPALFKEYLQFRENQTGSKPTTVNFRKKDNRWTNASFCISFENGKNYKKHYKKDFFVKAFLKNKCLRPSCYDCHFKGIKKSDFTLGDFWGINLVCKKMNDGKGTSLVLINTEKGKKVFDQIKDKLIFEEVDFEKSIKHNPSYSCSAKQAKRLKSIKI